MTEVYHSSTMGRIPLSFTGRHLMQNLREAVQDAIAHGDYHANHDALSRSRGKIAEHISQLEANKHDIFSLGNIPVEILLEEVRRRFYSGGPKGVNQHED